MFLNICFFYLRMKIKKVIIIKKMSLSKFSILSLFSNMLYSKNRKPETPEINRHPCKAENTYG